MSPCQRIMMIRPVGFGFNPETSSDNVFQIKPRDCGNIHENALKEFNHLVQQLQLNNIEVLVVDDTLDPHTPDSIFLNNWISFHENGTIALYPMYAKNRRAERKTHVLEEVQKHFRCSGIMDFTSYESELKFLEGTGSLVLDRDAKISYACLSSRTHLELVKYVSRNLEFTKQVIFEAVDENNIPIYHTNVLMCIASKFAVICLEAIRDEAERQSVTNSLIESGKQIIEITLKQLHCFAGNMLEVQNNAREHFLVMSSRAYKSLSAKQINSLELFCNIIHSDLTTIENHGGGSARCMMAEIYLPKKEG